jgi:RNase adaptor protein for sRNA GlmZ degradation
MNLSVLEPSDTATGSIIICDEDHNDVAEVFHNALHTTPMSAEDALKLARVMALGPQMLERLREAASELVEASDLLASQGLPGIARMYQVAGARTLELIARAEGGL